MFSFFQNLWKWSTDKKEKQPPKKLTNTPWREPSLWNDDLYQNLLKELDQLQPDTKQNVLILGPVGSGKSSFINSVVSIAKGRKFGMAISGDPALTGSWTLDLAAYSNKKLLKGYRLFDCIGLEPSDKQGFLVDDLVNLIAGHIKNGYTFNPIKPIDKDSTSYRSNPTFDDQMHSVIFVVSAKSIAAGIQNEYVEKIRLLKSKLRHMKVPRVLVLTQNDLICDEVAKDVTKMFRSIRVQDTVQLASETIGIEKASIHPVVNYEDDFNIRPEISIPILLALRQALQYSTDRVDQFKPENCDDGGKNN